MEMRVGMRVEMRVEMRVGMRVEMRVEMRVQGHGDDRSCGGGHVGLFMG